MTKASALIAAAGAGERLGKGINKVFVTVAGKPILAHTLAVFEACEAVGEIIIVTGERDIEAAGDIVGRFGFAKVTHVVAGGAHRQDSVRNGLALATGDIIAIHDAARPMVTTEIIERSIAKAVEMGACVAAVPVIDTIKSASDSIVAATVDRTSLYSVQTPQTFRADLIRRAYQAAYAPSTGSGCSFYGTDDAALVERLGEKVAIVPGSYDNIKITTPSDLAIAECRLGAPQSEIYNLKSEIRVGLGFDVHALVEGRKLVLGGVEIAHEKGLLGHSDADVVLHAIADACLGAAALGDIGKLFPDTDPAYKGISSLKLLAHVHDLLAREGWSIGNVDAVVICEQPKIAPHSSEMRRRIAECLDTTPDRISVKGTTTERLGFTGRGEGIACQAVATVRRVCGTALRDRTRGIRAGGLQIRHIQRSKGQRPMPYAALCPRDLLTHQPGRRWRTAQGLEKRGNRDLSPPTRGAQRTRCRLVGPRRSSHRQPRR